MYNYDMEELYQLTVDSLKEKGVELEDIAEIAYLLQKDYEEMPQPFKQGHAQEGDYSCCFNRLIH